MHAFIMIANVKEMLLNLLIFTYKRAIVFKLNHSFYKNQMSQSAVHFAIVVLYVYELVPN